MSVRALGSVDNGRGLGVHDHVCWRYDDAAEFRERAVEFLADGVRAGQRVLYAAPASPGSLLAHLRGEPVLADALDAGVAQVADVHTTYPAGTVIDLARQLEAYAGLTEQAVADGFTGLRVAADVTELVRTPRQVDAFARYEHLVDRYTMERPFAALCAYDRNRLGDDVIADLACMHSAASRGATAFWVRGTARPGCAAAVGGDVDLRDRDGWRRALARADLRPVIGDEVLLDAADLSFIDHNGLIALSEFALGQNTPVVLLDGPRSAARVLELLDFPLVTVAATHA